MNVDTFSGDGSTSSFTLSVTPPNVNYVQVNIDGVSQLQTSYTVTNSLLVFDGVPNFGSHIQVTSFSSNGPVVNAGSTGGSGGGGAQGVQGTRGIQGLQGVQGLSGTQGLQGTQGTLSAQGVQGVQGTISAQGVQGTTGFFSGTTTNTVNINNNTIATSTTTGALTVAGGVGVGANLYIGTTATFGSGATGLIIRPLVSGNYGALYSTNVTPSSTNYTFITDGASPNFNGTYGVYFNINNSNKIQVTDTNINITPTTVSTSTTTGALTVVGGVGVGGTVTANKFVGDGSSLTNVTVNVAGSILGTGTNVTLVAGSYSYLFDNTGTLTMPANGDIVMTGTNATITAGGSITAGYNSPSGGTAFIAGNAAVNNIALGYQPTSGAANMAIRDLSTVSTYMYFDAASNTTSTASQFVFRSSSAYTTWAKIDQYGVNQPTRPAFRVYGAGTTSNLSTTVNTNGILNGNNFAVDYNQGTALSTSTGIFTAPVAGLYSIHLVARVTSNSAGQAQVAVIKNNGLGSQANQVMWETGASPSINHFGVSTISKLAAGDTLVLKVIVGSINFDGNDNWSVAYIG